MIETIKCKFTIFSVSFDIELNVINIIIANKLIFIYIFRFGFYFMYKILLLSYRIKRTHPTYKQKNAQSTRLKEKHITHKSKYVDININKEKTEKRKKKKIPITRWILDNPSQSICCSLKIATKMNKFQWIWYNTEQQIQDAKHYTDNWNKEWTIAFIITFR